MANANFPRFSQSRCFLCAFTFDDYTNYHIIFYRVEFVLSRLNLNDKFHGCNEPHRTNDDENKIKTTKNSLKLKNNSPKLQKTLSLSPSPLVSMIFQ